MRLPRGGPLIGLYNMSIKATWGLAARKASASANVAMPFVWVWGVCDNLETRFHTQKAGQKAFCLVSTSCILLKVGWALQFSSSDISKALLKDGFVLARRKGSHLVYTRAGHPFHVTVPDGRKAMVIGTLRNIYRQAGWPWPPQ